jgi:hypothetical protein
MGSPSLLPQIETLFVYARGLSALGIVLWLFFAHPGDQEKFVIQMLLAAFSLHLGFFFVALHRRWLSGRNLYWITLLFDVFVVTVLVRYTGGMNSDFYLLYFLSIGFGSYYLGMNSGLRCPSRHAQLSAHQQLAIPDTLGTCCCGWPCCGRFAADTAHGGILPPTEERSCALNTLNERTSQLRKPMPSWRPCTTARPGRALRPERHRRTAQHLLKILAISIWACWYNQNRNGRCWWPACSWGRPRSSSRPCCSTCMVIRLRGSRQVRGSRIADDATSPSAGAQQLPCPISAAPWRLNANPGLAFRKRFSPFSPSAAMALETRG